MVRTGRRGGATSTTSTGSTSFTCVHVLPALSSFSCSFRNHAALSCAPRASCKSSSSTRTSPDSATSFNWMYTGSPAWAARPPHCCSRSAAGPPLASVAQSTRPSSLLRTERPEPLLGAPPRLKATLSICLGRRKTGEVAEPRDPLPPTARNRVPLTPVRSGRWRSATRAAPLQAQPGGQASSASCSKDSAKITGLGAAATHSKWLLVEYTAPRHSSGGLGRP
mmetsp:Transcript_145299/g.404977  ORF Transcript_145299/g.404977 Transcript_145299/m.404977 type:complete len:223 (+) Transcript_145299:290-958(+)